MENLPIYPTNVDLFKEMQNVINEQRQQETREMTGRIFKRMKQVPWGIPGSDKS